MSILKKIIHWLGIDDHADKWTIAHFEGAAEKPAKEFELVPGDAGYRKLISYAKNLGGEVRVAYEAGPCGYELIDEGRAELCCGGTVPDSSQAGRKSQNQSSGRHQDCP